MPETADTVTLAHDERHVRRKALSLAGGDRILVDLAEPVMLGHGDRLILEDGRQVAVQAAEEPLYAITPRDPLHLSHLCWHIGNRHLAAQIEEHRILILRDHVIKAMLEGLGAKVEDVTERFMPVQGAYSGHGHAHAHHHHHDGGNDHHHD